MPAGAAASRPVEISVPHARRPRLPGARVHRKTDLEASDVTTVDSIPVTTAARTLIDMAAVVPPDVLEEAVDDALRRNLVTLRRLRSTLLRLGRKGRPGITVMRAVLDARDPATALPDSVFERRLNRALSRSGLPRPIAQYKVRVGGRVIARPDFAWPDVRVAVEAEGYRWHSSRTRWEKDLARRNRLTALGWHVIHVTWTELRQRPDAVIRLVEAVLRQREPA